ncbi:P2X purinoceptor 7-like [Alca torda]
MTNIIKTENQFKGICPEVKPGRQLQLSSSFGWPTGGTLQSGEWEIFILLFYVNFFQYPFAKAICSSDSHCKNGSVDILSNGIQTGRCVVYNATFKTCEVNAWCPVQYMGRPPEPAVLRSSEDFTVLIKNNIKFPKLNYTTRNIPTNFNSSCTYNKTIFPLCPIFRLGDIVQEAKQKFSEMAVKGGIIAIEIKWDCNLDSWFYDCSPKYGFYRLDDEKIMPGFHFRYAKYYKLPQGEEQRTLYEVYGIRFDIIVFGMVNAILFPCGGIRKLAVSYYSNCGKSAFCKIYNRKKYETVLNPRQVMCVSHVDESHVTLIKKPLKTSLQHAQGSIVEKDNPPPDLLIYHHYLYCAVSNEKANGEDDSLQLDEAANAVFFNLCWELLLQSHPVKFCDAGSCCTSESNEHCDNEESDPMRSTESNKNDDNEEYELKQPLRQGATSPDSPKWCCCGKCRSTQKYHEQLCCRRKKGQCITTSHWFQQLVLSSRTLKKALLYKDPFLDLTDGNINNQMRHLAYMQYIHWRFGSFDLEDRAVIPSCCRWKIRDTYPKVVNNYTGFKME